MQLEQIMERINSCNGRDGTWDIVISELSYADIELGCYFEKSKQLQILNFGIDI